MDKVEKLKKDVGIRARRIRERLGFKSRESFAEILDVHSNTVGQLERGTIWLSPEMATLYYEKFGIDPAEFLTEKPVVIQPSAEEAWEVVGRALKERGAGIKAIDDPLIQKVAALGPNGRRQLEKSIDIYERADMEVAAKSLIDKAK